MKKSLVLAMAMALGVTASAYAANPFSDVPAGHWAYDAVNKLAAEGVVDGYPDGTYGGDKLMTRYEMAQIVAKAMAKGANVDKLAAEFADELDSLGVRVANLEKKADNVKITGEIRYHYADNDAKDFADDGNANKLRTRIWVNGQVNEDWTYTGMFENTQNFDNNAGDETVKLQRAYVNGKLGGVKVQAGRYNLKLADGNVYDTRFDGVQASYGKDVKVTAGYGKATPSSVVGMYFDLDKDVTGNESLIERKADESYYAEVAAEIGVVGLNAGYYRFNDIETFRDNDGNGKDYEHFGYDDNGIWAVGVSVPVVEDLKLSATYLKGDKPFEDYPINVSDDDGYVVSAKYKGAKASEPGSWGLSATYYDQGYSTYIDHTMNGLADNMLGFKGYSVIANYTFAKNIVGQVEWYDLEEKEGAERDADTLWAQLLFTF